MCSAYRFSLGLLGCMLGYSAVAADSLCSGQETRVFNCAAGSKIVSVCASTTLTKSAGYLQYRFGSKTAAEVQIPAAQTHPDTSIKAGNLMFAGGGGAYLRFANGGYEYVVYTAIGKGWGTKEGVAVQKGGKPVANIKCSKLAESKLGAEFFEQAGLASDEGDFDLP